MSIKGLQPKDMLLPKNILEARKGIYFSSIILSMWDNIHGPKVIQVWEGSNQSSEDQTPLGTDTAATAGRKSGLTTETLEDTLTSKATVSDLTLLSVANYTLNDEAARTENIASIESKFYSLARFKIIAFANIFTIKITETKTEVFSFILILPDKETSEFLARYELCEMYTHKLLQESIVTPLNNLQALKPKHPIKAKVEEVLKNFKVPLLKFTQTMLSVRLSSLPDKIQITSTYLGMNSESARPDVKHFLNRAITSHIQTSGHTIVVGSDKAQVNKMIRTLGMFLSLKERKMSRLVCDLDLKDGMVHFEPYLFTQGYVTSQDSQLPFTRNELNVSKLPPTLIHMDHEVVSYPRTMSPLVWLVPNITHHNHHRVRMFDVRINHFIWMKEFDHHPKPELPEKRSGKSGDSLLGWKDFKEIDKDTTLMSQLVQDFLANLWLLSNIGGLRDTYIGQFLRLVRLKALALAKYLESECKTTRSLADRTAELIILKANPGDKQNRVSQVQQDMAIDSMGDLYVVLAFTEKIRAKTYFDVLGDPQQENLAVIHEFASL